MHNCKYLCRINQKKTNFIRPLLAANRSELAGFAIAHATVCLVRAHGASRLLRLCGTQCNVHAVCRFGHSPAQRNNNLLYRIFSYLAARFSAFLASVRDVSDRFGSRGKAEKRRISLRSHDSVQCSSASVIARRSSSASDKEMPSFSSRSIYSTFFFSRTGALTMSTGARRSAAAAANTDDKISG